MVSGRVNNRMNGKMVSWLAMFTALSAVGAMIKVPAIVSSVALDAFPALLAAALLGGRSGAIVGGVGHLLSALIGGFPLGAMHLVIAVEMAVIVWIFGFLYKLNKKFLAGLVFIIGNSIVAPLPFILLMNIGFYMSIVPSLLIGSIINLVVFFIVVPRLSAFLTFAGPKRDVHL